MTQAMLINVTLINREASDESQDLTNILVPLWKTEKVKQDPYTPNKNTIIFSKQTLIAKLYR